MSTKLHRGKKACSTDDGDHDATQRPPAVFPYPFLFATDQFVGAASHTATPVALLVAGALMAGMAILMVV